MNIYRCENPKCGRDFSVPTDLKKVTIQIDQVNVDCELCPPCCDLLQRVIESFLGIPSKLPPDAAPQDLAATPSPESVPK